MIVSATWSGVPTGAVVLALAPVSRAIAIQRRVSRTSPCAAARRSRCAPSARDRSEEATPRRNRVEAMLACLRA
jgi:hypothetical protein